MHQDYCEMDFEDDDENCAEDSRQDGSFPTCNRHTTVRLSPQGKCHECELLRGRNRKFSKGRF